MISQSCHKKRSHNYFSIFMNVQNFTKVCRQLTSKKKKNFLNYAPKNKVILLQTRYLQTNCNIWKDIWFFSEHMFCFSQVHRLPDGSTPMNWLHLSPGFTVLLWLWKTSSDFCTLESAFWGSHVDSALRRQSRVARPPLECRDWDSQTSVRQHRRRQMSALPPGHQFVCHLT